MQPRDEIVNSRNNGETSNLSSIITSPKKMFGKFKKDNGDINGIIKV